MTTQFIVNEKGEKTSVIIPINEFEDLINNNHLNWELTDDYQAMMDEMIREEESGEAKYLSLEDIQKRFPIN